METITLQRTDKLPKNDVAYGCYYGYTPSQARDAYVRRYHVEPQTVYLRGLYAFIEIPAGQASENHV